MLIRRSNRAPALHAKQASEEGPAHVGERSGMSRDEPLLLVVPGGVAACVTEHQGGLRRTTGNDRPVRGVLSACLSPVVP